MSPTYFCASPYHFRDIKFKKKILPKSRSRSQSAIFAITPFTGKCQFLQMPSTHFGVSSYRFRDVKILNFGTPKSRSRSQSAIFAITPFDGKSQNLQMSLSHFCASSYCLRDLKIWNVWPFSINHWMANVKIYKCLPHNFVLALTNSEI